MAMDRDSERLSVWPYARRGLRRKQVGFLGSSRDAGLFADRASEFCDEFRNLGIAQTIVIAGQAHRR